MTTVALTFITPAGGIGPQFVFTQSNARQFLRHWPEGPTYDRVCVLEVPSPAVRARTTFQGEAHVFNREEAQRWAS